MIQLWPYYTYVQCAHNFPHKIIDVKSVIVFQFYFKPSDRTRILNSFRISILNFNLWNISKDRFWFSNSIRISLPSIILDLDGQIISFTWISVHYRYVCKNKCTLEIIIRSAFHISIFLLYLVIVYFFKEG